MIDLNFSYKEVTGCIEIYHGSIKAVVLRGSKAKEFCENVQYTNFADQQQLMARLTGNYKRGNERQAKQQRFLKRN
ncbi:MAG: hypothetical protein ACI9ES_000832 [Oceanospirillaceae bacterium]